MIGLSGFETMAQTKLKVVFYLGHLKTNNFYKSSSLTVTESKEIAEGNTLNIFDCIRLSSHCVSDSLNFILLIH